MSPIARLFLYDPLKLHFSQLPDASGTNGTDSKRGGQEVVGAWRHTERAKLSGQWKAVMEPQYNLLYCNIAAVPVHAAPWS